MKSVQRGSLKELYKLTEELNFCVKTISCLRFVLVMCCIRQMCVRSHSILSGTQSGSDLRYKLPLITMMDMIYHKNNFFGKL